MMQVNIGTEKEPIFVPEQAIKVNTEEGQEWWEMLSVGSIIISDEELEAILRYLKKETKE